MPKAARAFAAENTAEVRRLVRRSATLLGVMSLLLAPPLMFLGDAISLVCGKAYSGQGVVVSLLAIAMIADALEIAASNGLMGINRSETNRLAI